MDRITLIVALVILLLALVAAIGIVRAEPDRPAVRRRPHGGPRSTGLPPGNVVYSDADGDAPPLVARRLPLSGKPDYVVQAPDGRRVPVEIKSARSRGAPRREDVLQLTVYLMILDDLYAPPPRHGLLRYADATFEVPYTDDLRADVLAIVGEMRALDEAADDDPPPGDPSVAKCRACAFRSVCEDTAV